MAGDGLGGVGNWYFRTVVVSNCYFITHTPLWSLENSLDIMPRPQSGVDRDHYHVVVIEFSVKSQHSSSVLNCSVSVCMSAYARA